MIIMISRENLLRVLITLVLFTVSVLNVLGATNNLTDEEMKIFEKGKITDSSKNLGRALSIIPGYGIGQAVQGRWDESGRKVLMGQASGVGIMAIGLISCLIGHHDNGCSDFSKLVVYAGAGTYLGYYGWGIY